MAKVKFIKSIPVFDYSEVYQFPPLPQNQFYDFQVEGYSYSMVIWEKI